MRVRRRSVRRLWRRLAVLEERVRAERVAWASVRGSVASWCGLAKHADAFRLSRAISNARDVRNIGKCLLVRRLAAPDRSVCRQRRRAEIVSASSRHP